MISSPQNTNKLEIPLTLSNHQNARNLVASLNNSENGKRVYLNSLAVAAVQNYLGWMRISSHPLVQTTAFDFVGETNILVIKDRYLRCIPVLPGVTTIDLQPSLSRSLLGTVFIQLQEKLSYVELIGFIASNDRKISIALNNIASIELLLDLL